MNLVTLIVFALALSAPLASAQATQSSSGESNSGAGNFSLRTFRGCLALSGDQYELTVGGAAPHQFRLVGPNLTQLDGKAGHLVSITGTMPEIPPSSGTNAHEEDNTINFLSVDDLASTCGPVSDLGPATEIPYPTASAIVPPQEASMNPSASFISTRDPQSQPGSYMIVPLVGVLALGLLQMARYRRRK